jgi:hypothetical protein
MAALSHVYERGREDTIFGSHALGDVKYREDLMKSVIGEWTVEVGRRETGFRVIYANTFDELAGGLMNVLLTEDGQHYQHANVGEGQSLVIDIDGFTTDWLDVNSSGVVGYGLARSISMVIHQVISDFDESFRSNHVELVKDIPVLPSTRVRQAMAASVFEGEGKKYPCGEYADEVTSLLLNRFADTYQRIAGGALAWNTIILAGGGSALLRQKMLSILKYENVMLADQRNGLHLANVRGGLKLWRLYDALKLL